LPRSNAPSASDTRSTIPVDPALLNADLGLWAGERNAASGRKDALLGRVERLHLAIDGRSLEARVRGNRPLPYRVEVRIDRENLKSDCTCAHESPSVCRHAVAALEALRFPLRETAAGNGRPRAKAGPGHRVARGKGRIVQPARDVAGFVVLGGPERTLTRDERLAAARNAEISSRRLQARREKLRVCPVDPNEAGPARFDVILEPAVRTQRVVLRDPRGQAASCDCSDFAENELGTCRHVERIRTWILRKSKPPFADLISVWWQPRQWADRIPETLREIRVDFHDQPVPEALEGWFDPEGWLRASPDGRRPSEWAVDAIEAARRQSASLRRRCDVDPAIERRIRSVRDDEERVGRLREISPASPEWVEIRDGLGLRLHPYQEEGALFLARNGRAFLADDMGLGKTAQAIAATLLLRRTVGLQKTLIVCPASLKHQWRREIEMVCGERAAVVEGPRSARLRAYEAWNSGFLILNYELVLRDLDAIRSGPVGLVILDEAQRIKNWDTRTAREVKQLRSKYAFVLTGTPLENRLMELHSLVEFLHPRGLGPRWRLLPFHAVTEPQGRIIAYEGLDILRGRLRRFFIRRERRAVLEQLPPRTDNTFWTPMTPLQRRAYRHQAVRLASLLSRGVALQPHEVRLLLKSLTTMRMICNALAQFEWPQHAARLRDPAPPSPVELRGLHSPKLEEFARVLEDLLDESTTKIVVFSQWERMLRLANFAVRDVLDTRDLRAELFYGGLSSRQRDEILKAFREDPEVRVLFSTDAGGLGLNLQDSASIVVNLEVPWNPAILEQRVGRVHRMGQRESVQVLHFVTRGAIEERVRQVVESKRALFNGLFVDRSDQVVFDVDRRSTFVERVRTLIEDDG